ncbi:hypothetical protein SEA_HAUNTER_55 [Microbacterium phage Haunter]|nr:hypothetical protein SEA_HAUNTER_55 [Microbacterium phage Haunter]
MDAWEPTPGPTCCVGSCCGPGSYCCGHPDNEHEHTPEEIADALGPAASCHLCVGAGGYEDYDGNWVECSCQRRAK